VCPSWLFDVLETQMVAYYHRCFQNQSGMGMAQDQMKPSKPGKLWTGLRSGGWEEDLMGAVGPPQLLGLQEVGAILPQILKAAAVGRRTAGVEENEAESE